MRTNKKLYYLNYLSKSIVGDIYRFFILFPFLKKFISKDDIFLDYGCGLGLFLSNLKSFKNCMGCDINEYFVNHCLLKNLKVKKVEIHKKIVFPGNFFDVILMDNVLEHIENPKFIINDLKRVLKKNGLIILGVPGIKGFRSDSDHKFYYDEIQLISLAKSSGFSLVKIYHLPFFLKSNLLSKNLKSYCVYGIFKKC
jgi:SAM-dependent methyltransferase